MRRIILSLGVVLLASVPASAQSGRQLTLEDYYEVKSVGSPRISPAGDWVAYTVSRRIEETNGTATESWIVRADGSAEPVRVQHNGQDVGNPRWAEDGRLRVGSQGATWLIDPARPGDALRSATKASRRLASRARTDVGSPSRATCLRASAPSPS